MRRLFSRLALKALPSWQRRANQNLMFRQSADMATLPKSFPAGTTFFNVEGIPVAVTPGKPPPPRGTGKWPTATAFAPGKPARSFPWSSVMRNGSPCTEAEFRAYASLPAKLRELVGDDGIPILSESVYWENVGADAAKALAVAAIARAAHR